MASAAAERETSFRKSEQQRTNESQIRHTEWLKRKAAEEEERRRLCREKYPPQMVDKLISENLELARLDFERLLIGGYIPSVPTPEQFKNHTVSSYPAGQDDKLLVARYALRDTNNRGAFLWGETDSGKTGLAIALRNELVCRHVRIHLDWDDERMAHCGPGYTYDSIPTTAFIKCADLLEDDMLASQLRLSAIYSSDQPHLFILDDLGAGDIKADWKAPRLTSLIDTLYEKRSRIIVTSNFSIQEISAMMDDRISSRLLQRCQIIHLDPIHLREKYNTETQNQYLAEIKADKKGSNAKTDD